MIGCKLSTRVVWTGAACQDRMEGGTGKFLSLRGLKFLQTFLFFSMSSGVMGPGSSVGELANCTV